QSLAYVTVLDGHQIVGIISRKAIKQLAFGYEANGYDDVETGVLDMLEAKQVMERDTPLISASAPIDDVAELMARGKFSALPAVDAGKPVGIIDISDIVLFLLKNREDQQSPNMS